MNKKLSAEVARLEKMSVNQLAERFEEVFGEQCRSRHKRYLIRRIAWRLQANAERGLTERARQRAAELANDAEMRVTPHGSRVQPTTILAPRPSGSIRDATRGCRRRATGWSANI